MCIQEFPVTQDETGLAVVMGHEIAHAIAEHGNERMSQQLLQQVGAVGSMVAMKDEPAETQALWLSVYGVGTTVGVILPYSRTQESEADHLGLIFMAMAGYDPYEAPQSAKNGCIKTRRFATRIFKEPSLTKQELMILLPGFRRR